MDTIGTLHLFPTPLSVSAVADFFPVAQLNTMKEIEHWIVETPKVARAQLRQMMPDIDLQPLKMSSIGKHDEVNPRELLDLCLQGVNIGLISDAGMPAVADPGQVVVAEAHRLGIPVKPWPGPNSMMLALMASGSNGQSFRFHGYLPHDQSGRRRQLISMIQAAQRGESQIWMETPYRNGKHLQELCQVLPPTAKLTLACDITSEHEFIQTQVITDWSKWAKDDNLERLHKRPIVWVLGAS